MSNRLRIALAFLLVGDFGTNAEPAIPLLIAALGTSDDIIMGHAAIALGEIHRQPEVCVPALIPLLSSPSVSSRQKSLGALGAFEAAATPFALGQAGSGRDASWSDWRMGGALSVPRGAASTGIG